MTFWDSHSQVLGPALIPPLLTLFMWLYYRAVRTHVERREREGEPSNWAQAWTTTSVKAFLVVMVVAVLPLEAVLVFMLLAG